MPKCAILCLDRRGTVGHYRGMKNTLTFTQLVKHTGIARRTLYRMIDDGRFSVKPIKGMSPRRWSLRAVNKWRAKFK